MPARDRLAGRGPAQFARWIEGAGKSCAHRPDELGWIRTPSLLLEADSTPGVLIPPYGYAEGQDPGGYRVVPRLRGAGTSTDTQAETPHTRLAEGDRVFVSWATDKPYVLQHREPEFGTIQTALALEPDSMPGVLIPAADYRVLQVATASAITSTTATVGDHGTHTHALPNVGVQVGDRVFLNWSDATAVVVGKL